MTFENYLMDICPSHTNNGPEGFERWLEDLDTQDVMDYAEGYGEEIRAELRKKVEQTLEDVREALHENVENDLQEMFALLKD